MASIPLKLADQICDNVIAAGRELGLKPLGVAVVDDGGWLISYKRADGASFFRFELAYGKAYAAAGLGFPKTSGLQQFLESRPLFNEYLNEQSNRKFLADAGGVKIHDANGKFIGAVGVTGDVSLQDEQAALMALDTLNLRNTPT